MITLYDLTVPICYVSECLCRADTAARYIQVLPEGMEAPTRQFIFPIKLTKKTTAKCGREGTYGSVPFAFTVKYQSTST